MVLHALDEYVHVGCSRPKEVIHEDYVLTNIPQPADAGAKITIIDMRFAKGEHLTLVCDTVYSLETVLQSLLENASCCATAATLSASPPAPALVPPLPKTRRRLFLFFSLAVAARLQNKISKFVNIFLIYI